MSGFCDCVGEAVAAGFLLGLGDAEDVAFSSGEDTAAVGFTLVVGAVEALGSGVALVTEAGLFFTQAASAGMSRMIRNSAIKHFFMAINRLSAKSGSYLKPILVQIANAVIKSDKYPECKDRCRRLKARCGHK